jgi:hypothetical protein
MTSREAPNSVFRRRNGGDKTVVNDEDEDGHGNTVVVCGGVVNVSAYGLGSVSDGPMLSLNAVWRPPKPVRSGDCGRVEH